MKRDEALELSEKAIQELAESLKSGHSEALTKYLAMLSRFHRYSFGNVMMIYTQFPQASQVAGFTTWKRLGRKVKKGEKGIAILAPLVAKANKDDKVGETEPASTKVLFGFKVAHVFDVSQTEGEPLAEFASITGDPGDLVVQVRDLIQAEGFELVYEQIPGGALGQCGDSTITVVPDLDPAEEIAVSLHELAHGLLHRGDRRQETTKTIRETEAEAVAFVVCRAIGLDTSTRSSDYIQLYNGDVETLTESLNHIQRASNRILQALEVSPAAQGYTAGKS